MMEIRKVNPLSAGKIGGLITAGIHVIIGMAYIVLVALVFFLSLLFSDTVSSVDLLITLLGGVLIIVFGGAFGLVVGYVSGYLGAVVYNWITEYTGGLRIEIVDARPVPKVEDVKKVEVKIKKTPQKRRTAKKKTAVKKASPKKKATRKKSAKKKNAVKKEDKEA